MAYPPFEAIPPYRRLPDWTPPAGLCAGLDLDPRHTFIWDGFGPMQGVGATCPVSPTEPGGRSHAHIPGAPPLFPKAQQALPAIGFRLDLQLAGRPQFGSKILSVEWTGAVPRAVRMLVGTRQSLELAVLQTGTPGRSGGTHARARARTSLFALARSLWTGVRPSRIREPEFMRVTPVHSLCRHRRQWPRQ